MNECSVCCENAILPVETPCKHIFCFLCIKGNVLLRQQCPYCRCRVPISYLKNPRVVKQPISQEHHNTSHKVWLYEGNHGWWENETRVSKLLEEQFLKDKEEASVLIAGFMYTIDFKRMTQWRTDQSGRIRRIKRDIPGCQSLGVAGIKRSALIYK